MSGKSDMFAVISSEFLSINSYKFAWNSSHMYNIRYLNKKSFPHAIKS